MIFETERLCLRKFKVSDAESMYDLNLDIEVLKYTGDEPFKSVEESSHFLENYSDYKKNGFGRWAVILKDTNKFIGWCGLKLNEEGLIDIGFRFLQKEWGKGYATESAEACLKYGFEVLGMEEIVGRASKDNIASIRVLEKIGMMYWKTKFCEGINDSVYYKIVANNFL